MKRPWQVWTLFVICLLMAMAGMSWLTVKAVELERQERLLTLRADFEGDVRLALRRMDLELAEIFAQESAWPHFAYQAFYVPERPAESNSNDTPRIADSTGGKAVQGVGPGQPLPGRPAAASPSEPVASPLLVPRNAYVRLYFQLSPSNRVESPNVPEEKESELALRNGVTLEMIDQFKNRLADLQVLCDSNDLAKLLAPPRPIAAPLAQNDVQTVAAVQQDEQVASLAQQQAPFEEINAEAQATDPGQQGGQPQSQSYGQRFSIQEQNRRGNLEFQTRKRQFDDYAVKWNARLQQEKLLANSFNDQQQQALLAGAKSNGQMPTVLEGRSRAMWIDSQLVLARRLLIDGQPVIQGCWLDWPAIKQALAEQVSDLLPELEVVPVHDETEVDLARMLATLPAQLVVPTPVVSSSEPLSPIQVSLIAAWAGLVLAAVAVAILLAGVMALSERRAAFVSAVTHELRTPLTTFRMYAEMLAEGMVPEESRRQQYLNTLKTEADRLFHLVENVLSYARLERGQRGADLSTVSVNELVQRMQRQLSERAQRSGMELVVSVDQDAAQKTLKTDVGAVEQVLVNLVDNACKYAGNTEDNRIHLEVDRQDRAILLRLRDHGPGISAREVARLFRPFTKSAREAAHSAPGVGLGLALCRRIARQIGGKFYLEAPNGDGANFTLKLPARPA